MAGAFVGVADDATAVYWNPAGLATGPLFSLAVEHERLETIPDASPASEAFSGNATLVALSTPPLGVSYYRLASHALRPRDRPVESNASDRQDRQGLQLAQGSLVTHHTGVTLVQSLVRGVAIGATLKSVRGTAALGEGHGLETTEDLLAGAGDLDGRTGTAFDLDVGAMAAFGSVQAGVVVRNLREPEFETPDGSRLVLQRQVRVGVAVMVARPFTIAADVDLVSTTTAMEPRRNVAVGAERWWLGRRLAARGGVRASTAGRARPVVSGGVGVKLSVGVTIDGQITRGQQEADRGWGLGASLRF